MCSSELVTYVTSTPGACVSPACYWGVVGARHWRLHLMIKGSREFQDSVVAYEECWENMICKISGSLKA